MLPNKLKNTASDEIGKGVFSHMARHMHCLLASFPSTIIIWSFLSKLLKKKYSQAMHLWPQMRKNVQTAVCSLDGFQAC